MFATKRILPVLLASGACALAGCSSGGGSDPEPPPTPQPQAPTIMGLQNQVLPQDTTSAPLPFTVSDPDSAPNLVDVSAESSDEALISADGIVLGGDGSNRTIQITRFPMQLGPS